MPERGEGEGALVEGHETECRPLAEDPVEIDAGLGTMDALVPPTELELAKLLDGDVELPRRHQLLDEAVGDGLPGLVMTGEAAQHVGTPHPVLHDLARCLHEVAFDVGTRESSELGAAQVLMKDVPEFVEEGLDFTVLEQGRRRRRRLGEVCHHCADRVLV